MICLKTVSFPHPNILRLFTTFLRFLFQVFHEPFSRTIIINNVRKAMREIVPLNQPMDDESVRIIKHFRAKFLWQKGIKCTTKDYIIDRE